MEDQGKYGRIEKQQEKMRELEELKREKQSLETSIRYTSCPVNVIYFRGVLDRVEGEIKRLETVIARMKEQTGNTLSL